jgi:hypothetical protein
MMPNNINQINQNSSENSSLRSEVQNSAGSPSSNRATHFSAAINRISQRVPNLVAGISTLVLRGARALSSCYFTEERLIRKQATTLLNQAGLDPMYQVTDFNTVVEIMESGKITFEQFSALGGGNEYVLCRVITWAGNILKLMDKGITVKQLCELREVDHELLYNLILWSDNVLELMTMGIVFEQLSDLGRANGDALLGVLEGHDDEWIRDRLTERMNSPSEQAFTEGALVGALSFVSEDVGSKIASFLNRADGGQLALVNRAAIEQASAKRERFLNQQ